VSASYPGATSAALYSYARAALRDARAWLRAPLPPTLAGQSRRTVEAGQLFAVCALLSEADGLRARAREERAS